ncbi:MAG TPA: tRNA-binding protein [Methylomirabilota bacterium]|nr:tRNA-binding protein [Methylomirabilota bacterium]
MSVSFKEFEKLSLKVGKIHTAERIPGLTKILKVEVDIGERRAQAIAGGAQYYTPQELLGKRVIVITNMESKTIAGVRSEVMLLAADLNGKPIWLTVDEDVPVGTSVR